MSLGENTFSPFQTADARDAAHQASEIQRGVEDQLRVASRDLAEKEREYRQELSIRIVELHAEDGVAWTACETLARGEERVAELRHDRDIARGVLESVQQQAYRYAADRRDLSQLISWSMRKELRVDTPPGDWEQPGRPIPAGVNPQTGELMAA